jgi:hypothetical protein
MEISTAKGKSGERSKKMEAEHGFDGRAVTIVSANSLTNYSETETFTIVS